jgi:transcriptional regulator of acetoin/glycerol metabolism
MMRARVLLERRGTVGDDLLPMPIVESWRRCLAAGLDPMKPPPMEVVEDGVLREARQRRDLLRRLAIGEMENLYHQIAGTNFMIAFASADGILLDTIADPTFSAAARATTIRPGSIWGEARCGTNALGTAMATAKPVTVHGPEHFFGRYGALTCTAAPVFGADGNLAGVLDASSDCRSRQEHTRALVSMAATQIENGIFREHHRSDVLISFHNRPEYLHTLSAGLLAVDPGGMVLAANAQARFLLQGLPAMRGRHFAEIFRTHFGDLLIACRQDGRQRLEDRVGSEFAAKVENLRHARPVAVPAGQPVPSAALPQPMASPPAARPPMPFIAEDRAVAAALRQVEAAVARRLPLLIRGETGTGKEQVARHAHASSGRTGAFVPVNCAALPDTLVEAELFGHAEGAFTGARRGGAPGLAREADGGTLFLDEIGDMKLSLQSVLLRLLDDWTVRPVGGGRPKQVDVLLIAATNVALEDAVAAGRFRADLYYRLATVDIGLPPLRDRSDFAGIARHALASVAPGWRIEDDAVARLAERAWPGNIRELRAALARLTLGEAAGVIDLSMLCGPVGPARQAPPPILAGTLRETTRGRIREMFHQTGGNVSETARRLRISRNTVYRALPEARGVLADVEAD